MHNVIELIFELLKYYTHINKLTIVNINKKSRKKIPIKISKFTFKLKNFGGPDEI